MTDWYHRALAKSAPSDMIVVVKEHIPMLEDGQKIIIKLYLKPKVLVINAISTA